MNKAKKQMLTQKRIVKMLKQNISLILIIILSASVVTPSAVSAQSDLLPIEIKPVAAETSISFYITADGSLYACGYNNAGQLGDGTYKDRSTPVKILDNAVFVESAFTKNYAITKNGDLYVWGSTEGISKYDSNGNYVIYKESLGKYVTIDSRKIYKDLQPRKIMTNVSSVSANMSCAVAITRNGDLYLVDAEKYSTHKIMTGVKSATAKYFNYEGNVSETYIVVKKDGTVWSWGENDYNGILGDGTAYTDGDKPRLVPKQILSDVVKVSGGQEHVLALKTDGSLWAWGAGRFGALGYGELQNSYDPITEPWGNNRYIPTKVMEDVKYIDTCEEGSLAIKNDGSLWVWGRCFEDTFFLERPTSSGVPYKLLDGVTCASASGGHLIIAKEDGTLWMCGSNDSGQFGDGQSLFVEKPALVLDNVKEIDVADNYAIALKKDGSVWAWGLLAESLYGKAWVGIMSNKPIKVYDNAMSIGAAENHSLILNMDNTLWGWGSNTDYRLGDSTMDFATIPVKIMDNVTAISANYGNSAALRTDGSLWTWGSIKNNPTLPKQVGNSVEVFATSVSGCIFGGKDKKIYDIGNFEYGEIIETYRLKEGVAYTKNKIQITMPENVIRITAARWMDSYYTYLLTSNGELYNRADGYRPYKKILDNVKYMSDDKEPYIVKNDGSLTRYGKEEVILTNIEKVESSNNGATVLALNSEGKLYAWGRNDYGVVGNGTQANRIIPAKYRSGIMTMESGESIIPVKAVLTRSDVQIDGKSVVCEVYNINGNNYFKLRDLAMALNGTGKQFEVAWDGTKKAISLLANQPYTAIGDELSLKGKSGSTDAFLAASKVYLGGKQIPLAAYNINGSNYFKLRDIGKSMNFRVSWDSSTNNINVDTTIEYTEE